MKIFISILISIFLLTSCKSESNKMIEGDLYFKLINFPTLFGAQDSLISKFVKDLKTVNKDTLNEQDKELWDLFQFMYDQKLMLKPYVNLKQGNGEIVMIYLDSTDFIKLKNYNHHDLISENKKIRIKAKVSPIKYKSWLAYENLDLISIDKIDGKTEWMK